MKRFNVKNFETGAQFQVDTEGELVMQPEYGDAPEVTCTDLAPELALKDVQAAKERTNSALRLVAKQKINDFDLSQVADPVLRDFLSNIRLLLSKWN